MGGRLAGIFTRSGHQLLILLGLLGVSDLATAHPHVFIDYSLQARVQGTQLVQLEARMVLDPFSTTNVMSQFDLNSNNQLDEDEKRQVIALLNESMEKTHYFFWMLKDDELVPMANIVITDAAVENKAVVYHLLIEPEAPVPLTSKVELSFLDPENYFDLAPVEKEALQFLGTTPCHYQTIDAMEADKRDLVPVDWITFSCKDS